MLPFGPDFGLVLLTEVVLMKEHIATEEFPLSEPDKFFLSMKIPPRLVNQNTWSAFSFEKGQRISYP